MKKMMYQAKIELLEEMIDWVRLEVAAMEFSSEDGRKIELAMEEALVNVILHAYKEGKGVIELICTTHPKHKISFTIMDKGASFNPLLHTCKAALDAPLEEREEGGLGILFIREFMDEVHYERHQQYNVLTLMKFFSPSTK